MKRIICFNCRREGSHYIKFRWETTGRWTCEEVATP